MKEHFFFFLFKNNVDHLHQNKILLHYAGKPVKVNLKFEPGVNVQFCLHSKTLLSHHSRDQTFFMTYAKC